MTFNNKSKTPRQNTEQALIWNLYRTLVLIVPAKLISQDNKYCILDSLHSLPGRVGGKRNALDMLCLLLQ